MSDLPASAWKVATQAGFRRRDNDLRLLVGASRHPAYRLRNRVAGLTRLCKESFLTVRLHQVGALPGPFLRLRPLYRLYAHMPQGDDTGGETVTPGRKPTLRKARLLPGCTQLPSPLRLCEAVVRL